MTLTDNDAVLRKLEELEAQEMIKTIDEAGGELYGCQLAMEMMKLEKNDLLPEVRDVIAAGDFFEMAEGAQIVFV